MPQLLPKKMYQDIKDFYVKKHKFDTYQELNNKIYQRLKPRLQTSVIDFIYKPKYDLFKHIFENCQVSFRRELMHIAKLRYYSAKQEDDMKVNQCNEI